MPGQSIRRRRFLAGAAAGALAPALGGGILRPGPAAAAEDGSFVAITAAPASLRIGPPGATPTDVWAYDERAAGTTLRVPQGARLRVAFGNALPESSTIHWHGIRLPNAMDGVPGMTQAAVPPGGSFLYDFVPPDAGTYWYHPHRRSWEQQARGLAGALIVEEDAAPPVDRDLPVLLQDWRLDGSGQIHTESLGSMHDFSHAGRLGNWTTVNGNGEATWPVRRHERLRLRLINAATARIYRLTLSRLAGWIVATDGMPAMPRDMPAEFELGPAERLDLIVDVTGAEGEDAALGMIDRDGVVAAVLMPIAGEARPARSLADVTLPANPVPLPVDLAGAASAELVMEGGAMGGLAAARLGTGHGEDGPAPAAGDAPIPIRELFAEHRMAWAMNGIAGMPAAPLLDLARGQPARIRLVNDTTFPHSMHLHGHHFQEVSEGAASGDIRDTLTVAPRTAREIAFVADNPGAWMLHCHMAEHMAAGMMTWIRVA